MHHLISKTRTINGRRTTFRLEPVVWTLLDEISVIEECTPNRIIGLIEKTKPQDQPLASSIRVFIMLYFRSATTLEAHAKVGHGSIQRMELRAAVIQKGEGDELAQVA